MFTKQQAVDGTIAAGALASPLWVQYFEWGGGALLLLGGIILTWIRVAIAVREYRGKK